EAIQHYQLALTVYTRSGFPADWALTQHNLAIAYRERIHGERAANIEQSIEYCQRALSVYIRSDFPFEWATAQNTLANAYAQRLQGKWAKNINQAIKHYKESLRVRTRAELPQDYQQTQRNLGHVYFIERRWREAFNAFNSAIAVGDDLLKAAYSVTGRQSEVAETAELYSHATYCLLQLGETDVALVQLEAGKARLLADALALRGIELQQLRAEQRESVQTLRSTIRELETEFRLAPETPSRRSNLVLMEALRETRGQLNDLIELIRAEYPDFMPQGLDFEGILSVIPAGGALVAPLFTAQGSAIFVVPYGVKALTADHRIMLDHFTTHDLNAILLGDDANPGWILTYIRYLNEEVTLAQWHDFIESFTERLWFALMAPIHERLQQLGIAQHSPVVLMPQGGLGLLPLHAAWCEVDQQQRYFLDDYDVRFAPSAYALAVAHRRTASQSEKSALVAGVSSYTSYKNLPNVDFEIREIGSLLGAQPLLDAQATYDNVLSGVSEAKYVHLACHGGFAWGNDPLASALILWESVRLTLADVIGKLDLNQARLVVLSACETGITDIRQSPDEFIGLPAGFMQAGAVGVISSLWTVEDRSTALLMRHFYQQHLQDEGLEPAKALRKTQQWLRQAEDSELGLADYYARRFADSGNKDVEAFQWMRFYRARRKPFSNPYFWAAFTYYGI
ncbi:MAG: CHAT domain-containing tetratricopeptide repeat protein, partial [Chloroflexota bacterium]